MSLHTRNAIALQLSGSLAANKHGFVSPIDTLNRGIYPIWQVLTIAWTAQGRSRVLQKRQTSLFEVTGVEENLPLLGESPQPCEGARLPIVLDLSGR